MTRHEQIETISKKLETLDSEVLEGLIKLLGRVQSEISSQDKAVEKLDMMDVETRVWHDADLSRLGDYKPYDWGNIDPETLGKPITYSAEGFIVEDE